MNPQWPDLAEQWHDVYTPELKQDARETLAPLVKTRGFGVTAM